MRSPKRRTSSRSVLSLRLDVGPVCRRGDIGQRWHESLIDDRPVTSFIAFEADESVGLVDDSRCTAVDSVGPSRIERERLGDGAITALVNDDKTGPSRIGAGSG